MSTRGLQTLLMTALTDQGLLTAVLEGYPTAYESFELSPVEVRDLCAIQAGTLTDFAAQAHRLFYGEDIRGDGAHAFEQENSLTELNCA